MYSLDAQCSKVGPGKMGSIQVNRQGNCLEGLRRCGAGSSMAEMRGGGQLQRSQEAIAAKAGAESRADGIAASRRRRRS